MCGTIPERLLTVFLASVLAMVLTTSVAAQTEADFAVEGGWFFSQTGPGDGTGFAVTDADDIPFFTNFQALGGVPTLGYPVSRRFEYKGFTNQAFQKAILQWQPDSSSINFLMSTTSCQGWARTRSWRLRN